MNIFNYTRREESWQPGLSAASCSDLFNQMVKTLCTDSFYSVNPALSHEDVVQALLNR